MVKQALERREGRARAAGALEEVQVVVRVRVAGVCAAAQSGGADVQECGLFEGQVQSFAGCRAGCGGREEADRVAWRRCGGIFLEDVRGGLFGHRQSVERDASKGVLQCVSCS